MKRSAPITGIPPEPPVDQQTYVFAHITKVRDTADDIVYFYTYARNKPSVTHEHHYSPDKQHINNCYDQLKAGRSYIIRAMHTTIKNRSRWIWTEAVEGSEDQVEQAAFVFAKTYSIYAAIVSEWWSLPNIDLGQLAKHNVVKSEAWPDAPSKLEVILGDTIVTVAPTGGTK